MLMRAFGLALKICWQEAKADDTTLLAWHTDYKDIAALVMSGDLLQKVVSQLGVYDSVHEEIKELVRCSVCAKAIFEQDLGKIVAKKLSISVRTQLEALTGNVDMTKLCAVYDKTREQVEDLGAMKHLNSLREVFLDYRSLSFSMWCSSVTEEMRLRATCMIKAALVSQSLLPALTFEECPLFKVGGDVPKLTATEELSSPWKKGRLKMNLILEKDTNTGQDAVDHLSARVPSVMTLDVTCPLEVAIAQALVDDKGASLMEQACLEEMPSEAQERKIGAVIQWCEEIMKSSAWRFLGPRSRAAVENVNRVVRKLSRDVPLEKPANASPFMKKIFDRLGWFAFNDVTGQGQATRLRGPEALLWYFNNAQGLCKKGTCTFNDLTTIQTYMFAMSRQSQVVKIDAA